MQLSMNEAGVWPWVLVCNFDSGSWDGAKWWEDVRSSSPGCGLFTGWLHWFAKEILDGEAQLATHEGLLEVHATLGSAVRRKMPKVGASRWFCGLRGMRHLISAWTRRFMICLYLTLMLGNARPNILSKVPLKPIHTLKSPPQRPTARKYAASGPLARAAWNSSARCLMKREL